MYIASVLRLAGMRCGHEDVFGPRGPRHWDHWQGDSSWMAAPYLGEHPGAYRILVYRHPRAVISSFVGIGFYAEPTAHSRFALSMADQRFGTPSSPMLAPAFMASEHYARWNRMAMEEVDLVCDIEDIPWITIAEELELDVGRLVSAVGDVPPTINHGTRADVDANQVTDDAWAAFSELRSRT